MWTLVLIQRSSNRLGTLTLVDTRTYRMQLSSHKFLLSLSSGGEWERVYWLCGLLCFVTVSLLALWPCAFCESPLALRSSVYCESESVCTAAFYVLWEWLCWHCVLLCSVRVIMLALRSSAYWYRQLTWSVLTRVRKTCCKGGVRNTTYAVQTVFSPFPVHLINDKSSIWSCS
jgi:hypothetical protein